MRPPISFSLSIRFQRWTISRTCACSWGAPLQGARRSFAALHLLPALCKMPHTRCIGLHHHPHHNAACSWSNRHVGIRSHFLGRRKGVTGESEGSSASHNVSRMRSLRDARLAKRSIVKGRELFRYICYRCLWARRLVTADIKSDRTLSVLSRRFPRDIFIGRPAAVSLPNSCRSPFASSSGRCAAHVDIHRAPRCI